ncbi:MAG: GIY-YIG nuclease family protein [Planctomycetota bacterium]
MSGSVRAQPTENIEAEFSGESFQDAATAPQSDEEPRAQIETARLRTVVRTAFSQTHEGWSCDEVILNDRLHTAFVAAVQQHLPGATVEQCGWTLLNLRKAGKLNVETTQRQRLDVSEITHIAEIAARSVQDRYGMSTDRIMVTPEARAEFDALVLEIDSSLDVYLARRAAFKMRKQRRLRPELITRIADWGRTIESHSVADIVADATVLNEHPGIYIFRDETGYLYIGQTDNLRERLLTHIDSSHSATLSGYLASRGADSITIEVHDFDPDSRASETMVRRAYESELIASRQPRFNIQP